MKKKDYSLTFGYLHPAPVPKQKGFWAKFELPMTDPYHAKSFCPTCRKGTVHKIHTDHWVCCTTCGTHHNVLKVRFKISRKVNMFFGSSIIDQPWFKKMQIYENKMLSKELDELIANKNK